MSDFFRQNIQRRIVRHANNARIVLIALRVLSLAPRPKDTRPIAFFKASSGLDDLSWNSAFHLLTSWGLRLQGVPVAYFACDHGMSRCVLGTNRDDPAQKPPCRSCVYQAKTLYTGTQVNWFNFEHNTELEAAIKNMSLAELMTFEWPFPAKPGLDTPLRGYSTLAATIPLGALVLPGLRWILRRYNLIDDNATKFFLREYLISAFNVAQNFERFLDSVNPQTVVVFNGQFYPEATAKWVARRRGLRVITHEVGLMPVTAFFTEGEATIYPIDIPENFEMNEAQNAKLDAYLEKRFQGNFMMAGIKFWPSMKGLDEVFLQKAAQFKQIVPVFTNVIFDTSQPHANVVFTDMFAWLDLVLETAKAHPETLFIIRAHPDETRLRKASLETVAGWVESRRAAEQPNVIFVPPHEHLSSYELIQRSKFVLIYNSTIGLEASIMGAAVLCAGKARFTQYPTVFFPPSVTEYAETLERFLTAEAIDVPADFRRHARRFLYYQLFRTSLPFGEFLETGIRTTHAKLKWFDPRDLLKSPAIQTVTKGLLENGEFLLDEKNS
jgi:hypothetical protein